MDAPGTPREEEEEEEEDTMTAQSHAAESDVRRMPIAVGRVRGVASTAVALLLLVAFGVWPVGAQAAEEPELTWAPLVTQPPIMEPPVRTPTELADGYSLGAAEAPVLIEVWEDFQCPFCQRFTFQIKPAIVERFVETGQARLTFRDLAFLGDESQWAAVAASLAADQDRFWPFHDYLFANLHGENVGSYSLERLLAIGEASGLDMGPFRAGLVLEAARERFAEIDSSARREAAVLGINATPTVTVNGQVLASPDIDTVSTAVQAALTDSTPATKPAADPASTSDPAAAEASPAS
jgi:protein-disulfide isomerase